MYQIDLIESLKHHECMAWFIYCLVNLLPIATEIINLSLSPFNFLPSIDDIIHSDFVNHKGERDGEGERERELSRHKPHSISAQPIMHALERKRKEKKKNQHNKWIEGREKKGKNIN